MPESNCAETVHRIGGDAFDADERKNLSYRFATAPDLERFYGARPRKTSRAVAVLLNGEPVAIIGVAFGIDCATLYSDTKPEIEPYLKRFPVSRAIHLAMTLVKSSGRPVYSIRQEGTDILPRLGFEHLEGDVYVWRN